MEVAGVCRLSDGDFPGVAKADPAAGYDPEVWRIVAPGCNGKNEGTEFSWALVTDAAQLAIAGASIGEAGRRNAEPEPVTLWRVVSAVETLPERYLLSTLPELAVAQLAIHKARGRRLNWRRQHQGGVWPGPARQGQPELNSGFETGRRWRPVFSP